MKIYTLKLAGDIKLETKSYAKLYRYLEKMLAGGLSFGIDRATLTALGYSIEVR